MKIITPKFLKYFISNRRLPDKTLNEGKQALNLKECKKFLFMYKRELFSVTSLISAIKLSILIRILGLKIEKKIK
ncbi:hypothetical protein, partial [Fusobacterium varium]|uniref:hypothetical protein n=1 Tax=Fusobacterium varium TaxID=856 RepID=UPI0024312CC5